MSSIRIATATGWRPEPTRTGIAPETLRRAILDNLAFVQGRYPDIANDRDWYMALAYTVRDRLLERWIDTTRACASPAVKVVAYLSAEFLIGPQLENNLINLGIEQNTREALASLGLELDRLLDLEEEPGLGNGGLGRLAACYLDSLATLEVPAIGYGIRYEFGLFDQEIRDGAQVEVTDKWLQKGSPWEIVRPDQSAYVQFGGSTEWYQDHDGSWRARWLPSAKVKGVPHDIPVPGYGVNTCNTLRLWNSEAVESFDFSDFNVGDYHGAVEQKVISETLSKVLYPNDQPEIGRRLRLAQQYFFVSCSLQDMLRLLEVKGQPVSRLPDMFAVQLNDTHPAVAVAELMRLLVDERRLPWEEAWDITTRTLSYTNHTLLPEALETWGVPLFADLLPRPLEIIHEINRRFLDDIRARYPGDEARVARMSLIGEGGEQRVRMANLATVGSHAVNGVAALHSELLRKTVLKDFADLWPEKFLNITNGVTPRRFVLLSNPGLARLLDEVVGRNWPIDLYSLRALEAVADEPSFQDRWRGIKQANKERLARQIRERTGMAVDPTALFDIQVKRIHEYKRQHLNLLSIIAAYCRLRRNLDEDAPARCFVFGGKAAPGYHMAKLIIRLINGVAEVVNNDPLVRGRLKVVFYPDFNVKNAVAVYPAADLSEQISTAGMEASGTGNMKFMINGAVTIGTLDGANVEILGAVGDKNFFQFGLESDQVARMRYEGYQPAAILDADPVLREAMDMIESGAFARGDRELFRPLVDALTRYDTYFALADFADYEACRRRAEAAWQDVQRWTRMSIVNTARSGRFSSDRSIHEYCDRVWGVVPVTVNLD